MDLFYCRVLSSTLSIYVAYETVCIKRLSRLRGIFIRSCWFSEVEKVCQSRCRTQAKASEKVGFNVSSG